MEKLKAVGHEITHDWTVHEDGDRKGEELLEFFRKCAYEDFEGVANCDMVLLLNHEHGKGMFTEMGIALALGKPVIVTDVNKANNIFFRLPGIYVLETVDEAVDFITKENILGMANNETKTRRVLFEVFNERRRQEKKWGEQNHPDGSGGREWELAARVAKRDCDTEHKEGKGTFLSILKEEVFEAFAEKDPLLLRAELIQVAAVACNWVEAIDRKRGK